MIDGKELKAQLDECAGAKYADFDANAMISVCKAEYFLLLEENAEMKRRLARLELERNEKQKEL